MACACASGMPRIRRKPRRRTYVENPSPPAPLPEAERGEEEGRFSASDDPSPGPSPKRGGEEEGRLIVSASDGRSPDRSPKREGEEESSAPCGAWHLHSAAPTLNLSPLSASGRGWGRGSSPTSSNVQSQSL